MKLRNPTGRAVRLEVVAPDETVMTLTIGPGATLDTARYQRALDALAWAEKAEPEGQQP